MTWCQELSLIWNVGCWVLRSRIHYWRYFLPPKRNIFIWIFDVAYIIHEQLLLRLEQFVILYIVVLVKKIQNRSLYWNNCQLKIRRQTAWAFLWMEGSSYQKYHIMKSCLELYSSLLPAHGNKGHFVTSITAGGCNNLKYS